MKPAICCVCGKIPSSLGDGDWVKFQDYDGETTPELTHPAGLEYFCNEHLKEGRSLISMKSIDALNKLRAAHSFDNTKEVSRTPQKKWWLRWLKS